MRTGSLSYFQSPEIGGKTWRSRRQERGKGGALTGLTGSGRRHARGSSCWVTSGSINKHVCGFTVHTCGMPPRLAIVTRKSSPRRESRKEWDFSHRPGKYSVGVQNQENFPLEHSCALLCLPVVSPFQTRDKLLSRAYSGPETILSALLGIHSLNPCNNPRR